MRISDIERRRRLVRRHHLGGTAANAVEAVRGAAAFHATDPVTPYLGMWARVPGFEIGDLDRMLWEERALWRLHAMRRTLFLVPTDDAAVFLTGASLGIARKERARLEGWLGAEMPEEVVGPWLDQVTDEVMGVLEDGGEWRTQELTRTVPDLARKMKIGAGKWAAETPVSSRLLFLLAMEGRIVRTRPAGSWRSSQYRWAAASRWWDRPPAPREDEAEGRAGIAARYLSTHGPATLADLRWWSGWTVRDTRAALEAIGAVEVSLDGGTDAYLLASDLDPEDEPESPVVSFLPGLDPTPMGWKERDWYLGPHGGHLFDTNGNVGPTVWAGGRIVGGWGQRPDGTVAYELLEEVAAPTRERIEQEASVLSRWLDGEVVSIRFKTPLERKLASG